MKTEDKRVCPSCGNEFSEAVEFCPVCMMHKALAVTLSPASLLLSADQAEIARRGTTISAL